MDWFSVTVSIWSLFSAMSMLSRRCAADPHEDRLYSRLMTEYNPLERPVPNNSLPVKVTLGLILQQIVDLTWNDYKLKWEPREYGGVSDVRFPFGQIWKPDVLLYNSVDTSFDSTFPTNMVVYSDGTVNWIPPGIFQVACKIVITWFPFDEQSCNLKFGSWTYNGNMLDLQESGMDLSVYLENGEWKILGTPVVRSEKFYDCCVEPYPDLKFYINMRRRTLYYGLNLIVPSLLISLMTILGFTLPPDAGEKIGFEITILLSMCFFLGIVANMTPPTSEAVPLIVLTSSMMSLFTLFAIIVMAFGINGSDRGIDVSQIAQGSDGSGPGGFALALISLMISCSLFFFELSLACFTVSITIMLLVRSGCCLGMSIFSLSSGVLAFRFGMLDHWLFTGYIAGSVFLFLSIVLAVVHVFLSIKFHEIEKEMFLLYEKQLMEQEEGAVE